MVRSRWPHAMMDGQLRVGPVSVEKRGRQDRGWSVLRRDISSRDNAVCDCVKKRICFIGSPTHVLQLLTHY